MPADKMVNARLSLVEGKHSQPPNVVTVPTGARTFPVTVEWSIVAEESYVIGSHDPDDAHLWCVLDSDLGQVMRGTVKAGRQRSRKTESVVSRTLHGGGAVNPRRDTFDFLAARLKNGATYTLVASRHGVIATGEFVAIVPPRPRKKAARRKAVGKKAPVKKAPVKKATVKKVARKKAAGKRAA